MCNIYVSQLNVELQPQCGIFHYVGVHFTCSPAASLITVFLLIVVQTTPNSMSEKRKIVDCELFV